MRLEVPEENVRVPLAEFEAFLADVRASRQADLG